MSFLGYESVLEDMEKQPKRTSGTLRKRTPGTDTFSTTQTYADVYVAPVRVSSGLGGEGYPAGSTTATLWQLGYDYAPAVDDRLTVGGTTYIIASVYTRLNGDDGYAVHDCVVNDRL